MTDYNLSEGARQAIPVSTNERKSTRLTRGSCKVDSLKEEGAQEHI